MEPMVFGVAHLFCGSGGGALGFQQAAGEWRGLRGTFRTLCGIDVDPEACADFTRFTGAEATCMDLVSAEDYEALHGAPPPHGWHEATGADLRDACGGAVPDVVFASPPCMGFSSLLPRATSETARYQALNRLALRGVLLTLDAWRADPPGLLLLENVPRITSRGAALLHEITAVLGAAGYAVQTGNHNAGEIGALGQNRPRWFLIARHPRKCVSFVYQPPKHRLKSIGEVIGGLPMPDDPTWGRLHSLPECTIDTYLRLALIPAGGDWRDLRVCAPGTFGVEAATVGPHFMHVLRVTRWDDAAGTVTGAPGPWQGAANVADPRVTCEHRGGALGVQAWDQPSHAVTAWARAGGQSNMPGSVADPRAGWGGPMGLQPRRDASAQTVAGTMRTGSGSTPAAVSDPRPTHGSGAQSIADPRPTCGARNGRMGVLRWEEPAGTVTGSGDVHAQGAAAVADPRPVWQWREATDLPKPGTRGKWLIIAPDGTWHRPLTTLELAVLQGFPPHLADGSPLCFTGRSQGRIRSRIGNAVPPPAAAAIANAMLMALIPSAVGTWTMSTYGTAVWARTVHEVAAALQQTIRQMPGGGGAPL